MSKAYAWLKELDTQKGQYGPGASARKLELMCALEGCIFNHASQVLCLHRILCFLRAFPDDAEVLRLTEKMLGRFDRRADLRRHRSALADSGLAGTTHYYRYFWSTASWLAKHWPRELTIDWANLEKGDDLAGMLHVLLPKSECAALDGLGFSAKEWLRRLKGGAETDAAFLVRRFERLRADEANREKQYERLDVPLSLKSGSGTPSITHAKFPTAAVHYQRGPLARGRIAMQDEKRRPPRAIRLLSPNEGRRLVDLARVMMVTGSRDLDAFAYADERDVRLIDCGEGLQFACMGVYPHRRFLLESLYGFLALKNGVPVSYGAASTLFRTSEVAYSVFESYRSAETALIYGRWLAVLHHLLGSDTFVVDPYQLGQGNHDGIKSGAWWFYYKLGFRPVEPGILQIVKGETDRMQSNPGHRSSLETLRKLATENMYLFLGRPRKDVLGLLSTAHISLRVSEYLAEHYGAHRETGLRDCAREGTRNLGARAGSLNLDQRDMWRQWAPLVRILPGLERWSRADRKGLFDVIRAKGGRRESEFVDLFNRHRPLWRALVKLAREE